MAVLYNSYYQEPALHPILVRNESDESVTAIIFDYNKKRYVLSNELGHKVISSPEERPMTKKEFKKIIEIIAEKTFEKPKTQDEILDALIELDFGLGHANSVFQVNRPCIGLPGVCALIINKGSARYIFNQEGNQVYHINYAQHINGHFLPDGEEKENIINTLKTSKTLKKKLAKLAN